MSLKSSNKTDTNVYTLEIEIGAEPFKAAVLKAYNKAKNKIALPGFRKGKAPLAMIERFYGKDVFYEDALEIAFPEAVSDAYKEAGIEPVDSPKDVNVKSIGEDGVLFEMKVTVKPEDIKVKAYKGLEAEKAEAAVTPEEVDARIGAMRERNARTITVEDRAAAKGDIAVIDFEGFVDGKAFEGGKGSNYELELGSGQFIPGFEDQVIGHNAGESFDVNVKFPEEYTPELAGKDATFKVTLHEIKVKELPELDDEFAKDLDYDNVDELKKGVEADMLEHRQSDVEKEFEAKLMEELVANVEAEIPEVMFDTQKEENINNFAQRLAQQGIDVDTYLSYMGTDKKAFESSMREQNAVGCGDCLAALEFEYGRERVTEHGRRYNERKEHIFEVGDIELCKKYRSEAFCDIKQEAEHAELDADAAHNIGHAGIVILALFDDIDSAEQLWNKVAVHDASRNITCKSEKQIFQYTVFHSLHLSLDICENKQKPFSRSTLLL